MKIRLIDIADEVCRFDSDNKDIYIHIAKDGKPQAILKMYADKENRNITIDITDLK